MKVISAETMRLIDAETIEHFTPSLELMEKAGQACAFEINLFLSKFQCIKKPRILIICGSGNNGGDGFVIARLLQENYEIKICCSSDFKNLSSDAQQMASKVNHPIEFNATNIDYKFDIIVDCLLGTGINRNVSEKYAHLIQQINSANVPIISVDIPSGLNGNNGEIMDCAVKARLTLSIGLPKTGYYLKNGPATVGCLRNLDIGFPHCVVDKYESELETFFAEDAKKILKPLSWDSHKYTRGQCLIIGGSPNYSGAAIIAADCAAVCGAGLIMLARPGIRYPQNPGIVCLDHPQSSWKKSAELFKNIEKSNSILIGPGLEINKVTKDIFRQVLKSPKITIVDASAIDLIRQNKDLFPLKSPLVITPHQGELKRLANALGFHESPTLEVAKKIAIKLSIYVILKGPQSKVISPKGKISYNSSGSAALSCAGSGDALAGILVSLLANSAYQDPVFETLQLGVFIHGMSSELYNGPLHSFTPDHFPEYITKCFANLSSKLL